jgi:hypothetical protein
MPTVSDPSFNAALEARRAHLEAIPADQLFPSLRLEPSTILQAALGAEPRLEPFREALVAKFGEEAGELLDALAPAAKAAVEADAQVDGLAQGNGLPALYEVLLAKHAVLLADAEPLLARGHIPAAALAEARNTNGYQATVLSITRLVSVFRQNWSKVATLTATTEADLAEAGKLAAEFAQQVATRDQATLQGPATELRTRAISDAFRVHDELRRMMTYLRWREGDVDQILPSLYAGRGGRKPSSDRRTDVGTDPTGPFTPTVEPFEPAPLAPATPSPNNGGPAFEA